jgi:hypothetical protein
MRVALAGQLWLLELPNGVLTSIAALSSIARPPIHVIPVEIEPPCIIVDEAALTPDEELVVVRVLRDRAGASSTIVRATRHARGVVSGRVLDGGPAFSLAAVACALAAAQVIMGWDPSETVSVFVDQHPRVRVQLYRNAGWEAVVLDERSAGVPEAPQRSRARQALSEGFAFDAFRSASDPQLLARDLEHELQARLVGVGSDGLNAEIDCAVAELDALGHALRSHPDGSGRSFFGATDTSPAYGLDLAFYEGDEDYDTAGWRVTVGFSRRLPCPCCSAPMQGAGPFEVRFVGHGMADCPSIHLAMSGPSPISFEVGLRSGRATAGSVLRCERCAVLLWQDGPLQMAVQ